MPAGLRAPEREPGSIKLLLNVRLLGALGDFSFLGLTSAPWKCHVEHLGDAVYSCFDFRGARLATGASKCILPCELQHNAHDTLIVKGPS